MLSRTHLRRNRTQETIERETLIWKADDNRTRFATYCLKSSRISRYLGKILDYRLKQLLRSNLYLFRPWWSILVLKKSCIVLWLLLVSKLWFHWIFNVRPTLSPFSEELFDGVAKWNSEWKEVIFPSRADLYDSGPNVPIIDCRTCFEVSSGSQGDYAFSSWFYW